MTWLANDFERWLFAETIRMNERGLPIDRPLVEKTIRFLERYGAKRVEQCRDLTGGIAPTEVAKLQQWLVQYCPRIDNLQRVTLERVLREEELDPEIQDVIRIRLEQGRVATKKLYKMREMDSGDARMRGGFIYHGAGPGRFTAVGLQPHNFQRPTIKEVDDVIQLLHAEQFDELERRYPGTEENPVSVLEAVGSAMRGFFMAPKGMLIVRADYSAIEARVLAWLAHQDEMTLAFHDGKDVYVDMAAYIFGEDAETILAGHKAEIVEFSEKRKLGKDTILGCGYQMWIITFLAQMESKGTDKVGGIPIRRHAKHIGSRNEKDFNPAALELAKKAVLGYRERYSKIPQLWYKMERCMGEALLYPKDVILRTDKTHDIYFAKQNGKFGLHLPSGRFIMYPDAQAEKYTDERGKLKYGIEFRAVNDRGMVVWESMYGGKITENEDQGISRDLMAHGMWQADKAGFENIGTVHDEIITLHPYTRDTDGITRKFEEIICRLPRWAKGATKADTIPLVAEGKAGKRYGK